MNFNPPSYDPPSYEESESIEAHAKNLAHYKNYVEIVAKSPQCRDDEYEYWLRHEISEFETRLVVEIKPCEELVKQLVLLTATRPPRQPSSPIDCRVHRVFVNKIDLDDGHCDAFWY
jgi:hypothetical protein